MTIPVRRRSDQHRRNKDEQWDPLACHLGRADLLEAPDYATRKDRKANRLRQKAELGTGLSGAECRKPR